MGSEAIYKLKVDRPKASHSRDESRSSTTEPYPDEEELRLEVWDEEDAQKKLPKMVLSASGKAVRDTRNALKRTTKMLYRSLQKELPTLFERSDEDDTDEETDDTLTIPVGVARRAAQKSELRFLPGWSMDVPLKDGTHVLIRPLMPEDRDRLEEGFSRLSSESRYQRFMTSMDTLPDAYLKYLTEIDHVHHFAIAAAIEDPARFDLRGLGVARFIELPDVEDEAELAITIVDEAQGIGLGVIMMDILIQAAKERDFKALRAEVLPTNAGMQKLAKRFGGERIELRDGLATWRIPIPSANTTQTHLGQSEHEPALA